MTEYPELSRGKLYQVKNNLAALYDSKCNVVTHINYGSVVLLVDDQYYFMDTTDAKYYFMKSFQNLEENKYNIVFIKIVYDNAIGYANYDNFHSFAPMGKL